MVAMSNASASKCSHHKLAGLRYTSSSSVGFRARGVSKFLVVTRVFFRNDFASQGPITDHITHACRTRIPMEVGIPEPLEVRGLSILAQYFVCYAAFGGTSQTKKM